MAASASLAARPVAGLVHQPLDPEETDEMARADASGFSVPHTFLAVRALGDRSRVAASEAKVPGDSETYEAAPEPPLQHRPGTSTVGSPGAAASLISDSPSSPVAADFKASRGCWMHVWCSGAEAAESGDPRGLVGISGRESGRDHRPSALPFTSTPPSLMTRLCESVQASARPGFPDSDHLIEGLDPWEERKKRTGACARLVRYISTDVPRRDVSFSGGDGKRVQVTWMRAQGRAHLAGVKLGDTLASIDGWRVPKDQDSDLIYERLQPPCTLIFLGFIGKMNAEVRLTTDLPPCGLPTRHRLFRDISPLALVWGQPRDSWGIPARPQDGPPEEMLKPGRVEDEVDFNHSNESLYFAVDECHQEVSKVGKYTPEAPGVQGQAGSPREVEEPANDMPFSAVLALADCSESPASEAGASTSQVGVMEVKAREARALLHSVMRRRDDCSHMMKGGSPSRGFDNASWRPAATASPAGDAEGRSVGTRAAHEDEGAGTGRGEPAGTPPSRHFSAVPAADDSGGVTNDPWIYNLLDGVAVPAHTSSAWA